MSRDRMLGMASVILTLLLVLSGLCPFDRTTGFLEIFPLLIVLPVLWGTYRQFPLISLLFALIGGIATLALLSRAHDRQIKRILHETRHDSKI